MARFSLTSLLLYIGNDGCASSFSLLCRRRSVNTVSFSRQRFLGPGSRLRRVNYMSRRKRRTELIANMTIPWIFHITKLCTNCRSIRSFEVQIVIRPGVTISLEFLRGSRRRKRRQHKPGFPLIRNSVFLVLRDGPDKERGTCFVTSRTTSLDTPLRPLPPSRAVDITAPIFSKNAEHHREAHTK